MCQVFAMLPQWYTRVMAGASKKATPSGLTVKQHRFTRAYVENGGNATEAYKTAYNASKMAPTTIHQAAKDTVRIPSVNAEIARLLSENDIEIRDILAIQRRNMMQQEHLPTSQRAAEALSEMVGLTNGKNAPSVQVAFIINGSTEPQN
jgi:phage terminase small subunit